MDQPGDSNQLITPSTSINHFLPNIWYNKYDEAFALDSHKTTCHPIFGHSPISCGICQKKIRKWLSIPDKEVED